MRVGAREPSSASRGGRRELSGCAERHDAAHEQQQQQPQARAPLLSSSSSRASTCSLKYCYCYFLIHIFFPPASHRLKTLNRLVRISASASRADPHRLCGLCFLRTAALFIYFFPSFIFHLLINTRASALCASCKRGRTDVFLLRTRKKEK